MKKSKKTQKKQSSSVHYDFREAGNYGNWWRAEEDIYEDGQNYGERYALGFCIRDDEAFFTNEDKPTLYSIRCVKD